jgi:hypothetical protein
VRTKAGVEKVELGCWWKRERGLDAERQRSEAGLS